MAGEYRMNSQAYHSAVRQARIPSCRNIHGIPFHTSSRTPLGCQSSPGRRQYQYSLGPVPVVDPTRLDVDQHVPDPPKLQGKARQDDPYRLYSPGSGTALDPVRVYRILHDPTELPVKSYSV
jgi:hypothetical protein